VLVLQRRGVGPTNAGRWWAILPAAVWADLVYAQLDGLTEHHRYPVRLHLADAVWLLRAAGYGDPIDAAVSA
jgi:hypothetical protein